MKHFQRKFVLIMGTGTIFCKSLSVGSPLSWENFLLTEFPPDIIV